MKESARYVKIVEWSEEDQCYVGSSPGLLSGGCHGDDEQQVFKELCQIVEETIDHYHQGGRPCRRRRAGEILRIRCRTWRKQLISTHFKAPCRKLMNLFEYLAELRDRVWSTPTQNHSDLPLFELLKDISEEQFPNIGDGVNVELDWQDSEEVEGAKALRFTIPQGFVILEYWNDAVHGVCYQTPLRSKAASKRRNRALFDAYSDGQVWNKSFDNGYGVFYTRSDGQRHGVWSYHVDFVGVWTAEWQIAKDGNAS